MCVSCKAMKTISIKQPYATLICAGIKDVENRTWSTEYRGKLLIHASTWCNDYDLFDDEFPLPLFQEYHRSIDVNKGIMIKESKILGIREIDKTTARLVLLDETYRCEYNLLKTEIAMQLDLDSTLFLEHAIIGHVDILDVVQDSESPWSVLGCYHWQLDNAVLYDKPITDVKGRLRIWDTDIILDTRPKTMVKE